LLQLFVILNNDSGLILIYVRRHHRHSGCIKDPLDYEPNNHKGRERSHAGSEEQAGSLEECSFLNRLFSAAGSKDVISGYCYRILHKSR